MARAKKIKLIHMYPDLLNLYGDIGNIITLEKRCSWRNIHLEVNRMKLGKSFPNKGDIYFIGGGQDEDEYEVYEDLVKHRYQIKRLVDKGVVFLCVCAGFQLFGKYFIDGRGRKIEGLGILDVVTKAPNNSVRDRCIGNIIVNINKAKINKKKLERNTLVGFENHIGQTYLGKKVKHLGKVISGKGNNSEDIFEGAVYKNLFASYLHGPILSKNPHFADYLIWLALKRKYKHIRKLAKLDSKEEFEAHDFVVENLK